MIITLYRGAKQAIPERADDFEWPDFVAALAEIVQDVSGAAPGANHKAQKAALLAFSPVELSKPYRLAANVKAITLLVIDVDGFEIEPVIESIERLGIAAVVYGSPSDYASNPARRFRVVSPITRPIDPSDSARTRCGFAELLGIPPGVGVEGATSPEKIFFAGRVHDAPEREWLVFDGTPVDVDALLAEPLVGAWIGSAAAAPSASACAPAGSLAHAEAVAERRPAAVDGIEGGKTTLVTAIEIGRITRDEVATLDVLRRVYNPRCLPQWSEAELAHKARDAHRLIAESEARIAPVAKAMDRVHGAEAIEPAASPGGFPVVPLDNDRKGDVRPTLSNARLILSAVFTGQIKFDLHKQRTVVAGVPEQVAKIVDGPWRDHYTTRMTRFFETFGLRLDSRKVLEAVEDFAHEHEFNPVLDYATQCAERWDGAPRIDHALETYWRTTDKHAPLVSRTFFLSLAKRMVDPGCNVQTVMILQSDEQGYGKSRSLQALVPVSEWWADSAIDIGNKDGFQNIVGKVVYEIGEGASSSEKDVKILKNYFSSPQDTYRGSFKRFAEDVARTCVFVITANARDLLKDATGERRFMPVSIMRDIDVDGVARDRDQLIGEAVVRACVHGERYWLTREEVDSLAPAHAAITARDVLEDAISKWLDDRDGDCVGWYELASFNGPLRKNIDEIDQREQRRVRAAMRRLGWRECDVRDSEERLRAGFQKTK